MEIRIELDLEGIIAGAVTEERIKPLVDKAISDAVKDAIGDATGYNSEFRKAVKAQLAKALPHGLDIGDVAKFQHVANAALTQAARITNGATVHTALVKAIANIAPEVPELIKLSDLLEMARDSFNKEDHESFYAKLKPSEYGGGHLSLDPDEHCRSEYSAELQIAFNREGEVYSFRDSGKQVTLANLPHVITALEEHLLALYTGRSRLDMEEMDDGDVEAAAGPKD